MASAYGFTSFYTSGDLGQGETIALVETNDYAPSDILTYEKCYGIAPSTASTPVNVTRVPVDGGAPIGAGTTEAELDIEVAIGLAPSADVLVYENSDTSLDLEQIASDDTASAVSMSFGDGESWLTPAFVQSESTIFEEMAVQGQTMFADAGDSGSEDCTNDTFICVQDPASQPYVTGVGGTEWPDGTRSSETVWNTGVNNDAGGGGISTFWPMPSWQSAPGVPDSTYSSGSPCEQSTGYCREVPDVSALAARLGMRHMKADNGANWEEQVPRLPCGRHLLQLSMKVDQLNSDSQIHFSMR